MVSIGQNVLAYPVMIALFLIISLIINRILIRYSFNLGTRGQENLIRWSQQQKPSLGGFSFYILFVGAILLFSLVDFAYPDMNNRQLFALFLACSLGFFIGLADDAYNTYPVLKLLGQLTCANILVSMGLVIPLTPSMLLNGLFTIVWVVAVMNSINMLDNMDGITATVATGILLNGILLVYLQTGTFTTSMLLFTSVAATLLGFLYFNWHPSRIFMGDAGSQFLGIFLATTSIWAMWGFKNPTGEYFQIRQFLIPLIAFQIPAIDTATVILRRIGRGQMPFVGGRDHTTHHFAYLGLKDGQVSALYGGFTLLSVLETYGVYRLFERWQWWHNLLVLGLFALQFALAQVMYDMGKRKKPPEEEETPAPVEEEEPAEVTS